MIYLGSLGLRAGAAGWKAGHMAVRSGALNVMDVPDAERQGFVAASAAREAGPYMDAVVVQENLTPAQGVRLWYAYMGAFIRGALDEALDGGALYH
jgi:hypothetical protein